MIYVLIVIYNKKCEDSISFRCLQKYKVNKNIKIIIFDNSEHDFKNREYCLKENIIYYTKQKNIGLSKAYNYVIKKIKGKKEEGYLLLLDDDTEISEDYINKVLEKTQKSKVPQIFVPIVKSNDTIISPSNTIFNCRVKKVKDIRKIKYKKITAINSGMVVNLKIYNTIKYNENLFLDYVDHEFLRDARKNKIPIEILDSELKQSFSRDDVEIKKENVIKRLNIFKKDFKVYCKENLFGKLFYYFSVIKLVIKYIVRYNDIEFLKLLK